MLSLHNKHSTVLICWADNYGSEIVLTGPGALPSEPADSFMRMIWRQSRRPHASCSSCPSFDGPDTDWSLPRSIVPLTNASLINRLLDYAGAQRRGHTGNQQSWACGTISARYHP